MEKEKRKEKYKFCVLLTDLENISEVLLYGIHIFHVYLTFFFYFFYKFETRCMKICNVKDFSQDNMTTCILACQGFYVNLYPRMPVKQVLSWAGTG